MTVPYVLASPKPDTSLAVELLKRTDSLTRVNHEMQSLLHPFTGDGMPYDARAKGTHVGVYHNKYMSHSLISLQTVRVLQLSLELSLEGEADKPFYSLGCLPTPYKHFISELQQATKHPLPEIAVPSDFPVDKSTIMPNVYFSVFLDPNVEVRIRSIHPRPAFSNLVLIRRSHKQWTLPQPFSVMLSLTR
jgi:nuclear cap-binding protein subunit 1